MNQAKLLNRLMLVAVCAGLSLACSTPHTTATSTVPAQTPATTTPNPAHSESEEEKMPRISGQDAVRLVAAGQAVIVDVRSVDAWNMQHIKGAQHVPLDRIESGQHTLPRDKQIIFYCT